jgi:hypothetical protein
LQSRRGHVTKFNGKTIGTISKSIILINLDVEEIHMLTCWIEKEGLHSPSPSLTTKYTDVPKRVNKKRTIVDVANINPAQKA